MAAFKDYIRKVHPYIPPLEGRDPSAQLLLDFNERTIPLPQTILKELSTYIQDGAIHTYPSYADIEFRIAHYANVSSDSVLITNGSDHGIDLIIRSLCDRDSVVLIPEPTFPIYQHSASVSGATIRTIPYTAERKYPTDLVLECIKANSVQLIIVPNPNNPTGTAVPIDELEHIILNAEAQGISVLVDECYFEFSNITAVHLIGTYDNLFITRTFSKTWGLAGLRFGYIISNSENCTILRTIRAPYDINQLAVKAAQVLLDNQSIYKDYVTEVMLKAKPYTEGFLQDRGIFFWPSAANFLFCYFPNGKDVFEKLLAQNIRTRPKLDFPEHPAIRITIGTAAQMKTFVETISKIL